MTDRHDTSATLPWLRQGTDLLLSTVDKLDNAAFAEPSGLPGWSRAHLVGHVARNAEALVRLATWARTGVEAPMYADRAQRAAEIEESAAFPPERLRAELHSTAEDLDVALAALAPQEWAAQVRSALGRAIPAAEVPWMRNREVWLHAVDLDTGVTTADLPAELVDLLLDDVTGMLSTKDGCPACTLRPTDRAGEWRLGAEPRLHTVTAPAAEVAGWLTGRAFLAGTPALPAWL
ncbi:maleylpyruvate isomerase family mycothiol-dependent enzyme [Pseudonocardia sp. ICBG1034]|uniref:maleylpyruvate isomerase family mycothiol-dependent enzyme n=1 Tax=Pseudonocardia sp. ICBG1034 TaxID=2844381 RepID=UPI001CCCAAC0|nr:maleylpyruvate isomerase family mycothiol-dependent enzyme [Pseudonocardia sp. ICBG1034]